MSFMNKYIITEIEHKRFGFFEEAGHIAEIRCYAEQSLVGNVYRGVVSNIAENIGAAFVDFQKGESCYLALEDYPESAPLKVGMQVTVQITRDPVKNKRASASGRVSLTGDYVVAAVSDTVGVSNKVTEKSDRERLKELFEQGLELFEAGRKTEHIKYGGILRTQAAQADPEDVVQETVNLLCKLDDVLYRANYATPYSALYKSLPDCVRDAREFSVKYGAEIVTDIREIYDDLKSEYKDVNVDFYEGEMSLSSLYNLNKTLERATSNRVYLKSGAYLVIEPTEALTTVDVNSGKAITGRVTEEAIFKINCEAARELCRQMRLRNLSGIIIADFINMKEEAHKHELFHLLTELAAHDSIPTHIVDITKLGLVEITRKKIHPPLSWYMSPLRNC